MQRGVISCTSQHFDQENAQMALWHEIDLTTDTDVDLVLGYSCAFHRNGKGYLSGGSGLHEPDDVEEESLFSDYEELELSDCKVSIVDGSATIIYQSGMFNTGGVRNSWQVGERDGCPSRRRAVHWMHEAIGRVRRRGHGAYTRPTAAVKLEGVREW